MVRSLVRERPCSTAKRAAEPMPGKRPDALSTVDRRAAHSVSGLLRVLALIASSGLGGAERVFVSLLKGLEP